MKSTLLRLTPWIVLGSALALAFGLAGALAGAFLLAMAEGLQFLREAHAMRSAHAMALASRTVDAETQAARLTEIERQLKEALIPERVQLAKDILRNKLSGISKGGGY